MRYFAFLFALTALGQSVPTTISTCHIAGGIHLIGANPPRCVVGDEAGPANTAADAAWIYSGLEFPHPTTPNDRSCMVIESVTPKGYTSGWTPNLQLLFARTTDGTPTDQVNFTARVTYLAADSSQDIRSPKWGDKISVDDVPNGSTQMALWEPYVGTIHDIPTPSGLGTNNVPGARRNMAYIVCREDGPAHTSPFTDDGTDDNTGKLRVLSVNVRWEDASNVVQAETGFMPLTSTSQEPPSDGLPLPAGPENSALTFLSGGWKSGRLYQVNPQEISISPETNGICTSGSGTFPSCGTGRYWAGNDLLDEETDCLLATTTVPTDILLGAGVQAQAVIKPSESDGDFLFRLSTAYLAEGDDLSVDPAYGANAEAVPTSCAANSQQFVNFDSLDMTGALPGKSMVIRLCRIGADDLDTSDGLVTVLKLKIFWKRLIQMEEATAVQ